MQRPGVCVVVTGIGSFSPIGKNTSEMESSLRAGRSGVGLIKLFDTKNAKVKHAAEIDYDSRDYFSTDEAKEIDRITQFALIAAREAVADSKLDFENFSSDRIALVAGVCAGSAGSSETDLLTEEQRARREINCVRHLQTAILARDLGIHGLQASISTACASTSSALAYGFELLQAGRADVVIVGGADYLNFLAYAGFHALGAMATQPLSPFSTNTGVSFGEGAGFVVLESQEKAKLRGAPIHGELAGYGCTSDAYHITSPHPSGEGLRRAMEGALLRADATVEDVDYVNAHGTGTRDNDTAESLALSDLCQGKRVPPPMSSTKSMTGHTLGAAGILEFIACLLAAKGGFLPPTVGFTAARPGCELDYVPNESRTAEVDFFLSNSAAFGGVNAVVAGRRVPEVSKRNREVARVVITGIGVVSPAGCGLTKFRQTLAANQPDFRKVDRFDITGCSNSTAALVRDFKPRQLTPTLDVRRLDMLNQYASVSAGLAYSDACLTSHALNRESIGSVIAMAAGPLTTTEEFEKALAQNGLEGLSAKYFPAIVVSTVGGQVCQSLSFKGINSTLVDGIGAGLPGAIHAFEMLRSSDKENQILLVAPDEISPWLFRTLDLAGLLSDQTEDSGPYQPAAHGFVLGEGSIALVLEKLESAQARGAHIYAEIIGYGATCDTRTVFDDSIDPSWMKRCMSSALLDAHTKADEIDFAVGLGSGARTYDQAERSAFESVLGDSVPISLPATLLGLGLASSGAAALALGALGLADRQMYVPAPGKNKTPKNFNKVLVFGGSETGNHSAIVLGVPA